MIGIEPLSRRIIEAMGSDFKARGFGLEEFQIRHPERLARPIPVMARALEGLTDRACCRTNRPATGRAPLPGL
jgi:hypothetical protein